jgi:GDPmannose 4,6-dehydratase
MHAMLQHDQPDDYIVSSGRSVLLKDIIDFVFNYIQVPTEKYMVDETLFRPSEIKDLYGDSSKARENLGWDYQLDFFDVLKDIIEEVKSSYN